MISFNSNALHTQSTIDLLVSKKRFSSLSLSRPELNAESFLLLCVNSMDGFRVVKLNEVIRQVDVIITCTGNYI